MKKIIPSLNGLRALSILFVLFSHVLLANFNKSDNPGGQVGVQIFFIISGYLITILLLQEEAKNNTINLKKFYLRRTIRIFPVYYSLLFVYFLLQISNVLSFSTASWITSLSYTKYLSYKNNDWETGHLWSLSVEEQFYLLWPLIFKFFKKKRVIIAFLIIIFATAIKLFTEISDKHIFARADALMWGCVFAIFNDKLKVIFAKKWVWILPFATLLVCMLFKRVFHLTDLNSNIIKAFLGSFGLFTNLSICFIILVSIYYKNNYWYTFLNSKPLNYLGILSYSIYIWQQLFFSNKIFPFSKFPYNLFLIFLVANLSYYTIEKPFLKLKSKFIFKN